MSYRKHKFHFLILDSRSKGADLEVYEDLITNLKNGFKELFNIKVSYID
jgi:hypothetical protein